MARRAGQRGVLQARAAQPVREPARARDHVAAPARVGADRGEAHEVGEVGSEAAATGDDVRERPRTSCGGPVPAVAPQQLQLGRARDRLARRVDVGVGRAAR